VTEQIILQKKVEKASSFPFRSQRIRSQRLHRHQQDRDSCGSEAEYFAGLKSQMDQKKTSRAISALVTSLKEKAHIQYFVSYQ